MEIGINTIICPNCKHEFSVENELSKKLEASFINEFSKKEAALKNELNIKWKEEQEKLKVENAKINSLKNQLEKEKELQNDLIKTKIEEEKKKLSEELLKSANEKVATEIEFMKNQLKENDTRLAEARKKELEFLQKEQAMKNKEQELEITLQKKLVEERAKLTDDIRKIEEQKIQNKENEFNMRLKEMEKQLEDQKKMAEEMRRKAEQGSMQLQGEVQELALEELLKSAFPFDLIEEVGKGVKGADAIQTVRTISGKVCGKIIYESKRTKSFSKEWIEKLKIDLRTQQAHIAILVTEVMPKDMEFFGEKDGVWICKFSDVRSMALVLRDSLIKISEAVQSQENKGEKMQMLYNYLTSNEFKQSMEAIVEGFVTMKTSIIKEKTQMELIWKQREKQLEKVLTNATQFYGSVKGIAGSSLPDYSLFSGEEPNLLGE
jgi:hypothetical protein